MTFEEKAGQILTDKCASEWLRGSLRWAMQRDPVDSANDAAALLAVLEMRVNVVLGGVQ